MGRGKRISDSLVVSIFELIKAKKEITNSQLAELFGRPVKTIEDIRRCGSLEGWKEHKVDALEKKKERIEKRKEEAQEKQEEEPQQLPGQIEMELPEKKQEKTEAEAAGHSDQVKLMRFQAEMTNKLMAAISENAVMLNSKLDRLNDTLSMILRAVRKE